MSEPIKLVAFCGSLRKASFNRIALHAFAERLPAGATVETIEIGDWPLYNADIQAQGFPAPVQAANQKVMAADGVVFASPEYNYSVSGVLKNAIDWLSRFTPQPFAGKPMAVFGASGGPLGTARSQYHLRQMMIFLDGRFVNKPEVMIGAAPSKFVDGKFTDETGSKLLTDLGASLVLAIRQAKAAATVK
jgi:chromate reductase, NAD(P)H dehydrogenase (quinone)